MSRAAEDGASWSMARYSGWELLNAMQGPCQQRGIRCTDVAETGRLLLFERM